MTSSNEVPRLPADDLMGSRLLTSSSLSGEFEAYANQDLAFKTFERVKIKPSEVWKTIDGASMRIEFLAQHAYSDEFFAGDLFGITLIINKEINHISEDYKIALEQEKNPNPPDDDKFISLSLMHVSQYFLSQTSEFGWANYKEYSTTEYLGNNASGPRYAVKELHVQEECKPLVITDEDAYSDGTENIKGIVSNIAGITEKSLDDELKDCITSEVQLKRAYDLLLCLQTGNIACFDMSSVMPAAFLE